MERKPLHLIYSTTFAGIKQVFVVDSQESRLQAAGADG